VTKVLKKSGFSLTKYIVF